MMRFTISLLKQLGAKICNVTVNCDDIPSRIRFETSQFLNVLQFFLPPPPRVATVWGRIQCKIYGQHIGNVIELGVQVQGQMDLKLYSITWDPNNVTS